jgi:hypothetical protein
VQLRLAPAGDGQAVARADSGPILGYGPTTRWEPGELVVDEYTLPLDGAVQPGSYYLLVCMYSLKTGQCLHVTGAPAVWPGERMALTAIEIQ